MLVVSKSGRQVAGGIVTTATIYTLIADPSGDQICTDVQWLLQFVVDRRYTAGSRTRGQNVGTHEVSGKTPAK
ncbi:hypothetical protein B1756_12415 [Natrarchaeobaculum aegyptiacum]|uniref:Uncharacterized protein n=1 Tax=Natrarchaeobaculum aegyptiacum TaxID=745377 RepID=A0A2Z2HTG4_9EURY|nr:hypothetical protein B1756_12415 [Natrarchaeobaculum aegyptiacum]